MEILILYATIEGQTGKIARFAAGEIAKAGHAAELVDLGDPLAQVPLEGADRIILAASVHERRHPKPFETFLAARREDLARVPTLLLSVSLNAAFPEGLEEAEDYVTEMKMRTGFSPREEMLVAGAVRSSRYDYFATQVVRHVLFRGRTPPEGNEEHEFTDWHALAERIRAFVAG